MVEFFPLVTSWVLSLPFWLLPDFRFFFQADKHSGELEGFKKKQKNPLWIDGSGWRKSSYSNESITSRVQEKRTKCSLHICPNYSTCLHNLKSSLITNLLSLFKLPRKRQHGNIWNGPEVKFTSLILTMKKLCPRELNTPVVNRERAGKGTQDFWVPWYWAASMGHYGWNTSGSLEFLFYSTILYQCHAPMSAWRVPKGISVKGPRPRLYPRGSWAYKRQTKSSGRACFGRERNRVFIYKHSWPLFMSSALGQ